MASKKQKVKWPIICTAIVCITIIEIVALLNGIDGILLSFVLVVIAALTGVSIPQPKFLK